MNNPEILLGDIRNFAKASGPAKNNRRRKQSEYVIKSKLTPKERSLENIGDLLSGDEGV